MLKRLVDIVFSALGIAAFSILMLVVALLVRLKLGKPVIFRQRRPGKDGKLFTMYKFRTMRDDKDENGNLLPDDVRLTPFGQFLRSASLDELPELFNVLKGDMSLVGPRPLMVSYLARYTPEQNRRHEVKPGITGWAQVNGRNNTTWDKRLVEDVWYVDHQSFGLDMKILASTFVLVFKRKGISNESEGHVTMPEFLGTSSAPIKDQT